MSAPPQRPPFDGHATASDCSSTRAVTWAGWAGLCTGHAAYRGSPEFLLGRTPTGTAERQQRAGLTALGAITTRETSAAPARAATRAPCDAGPSPGSRPRGIMPVPMFRPRVAKTVAIHMPEIPCLARQDRLVAPGALLEAGRDRRG